MPYPPYDFGVISPATAYEEDDRAYIRDVCGIFVVCIILFNVVFWLGLIR
jgi:hypothetical protein